MGIGNRCHSSMNHCQPGKFCRSQHGAFNVDMRVNQAWQYKNTTINRLSATAAILPSVTFIIPGKIRWFTTSTIVPLTWYEFGAIAILRYFKTEQCISNATCLAYTCQ